jgi:hypothetical protein
MMKAKSLTLKPLRLPKSKLGLILAAVYAIVASVAGVALILCDRHQAGLGCLLYFPVLVLPWYFVVPESVTSFFANSSFYVLPFIGYPVINTIILYLIGKWIGSAVSRS